MIEAPTVRIEAFDLKGRRIAGNTIAVAQAGVHSAQLAGDPSFKPGISFLRLTQGSVSAMSRVIVLASR